MNISRPVDMKRLKELAATPKEQYGHSEIPG